MTQKCNGAALAWRFATKLQVTIEVNFSWTIASPENPGLWYSVSGTQTSNLMTEITRSKMYRYVNCDESIDFGTGYILRKDVGCNRFTTENEIQTEAGQLIQVFQPLVDPSERPDSISRFPILQKYGIFKNPFDLPPWDQNDPFYNYAMKLYSPTPFTMYTDHAIFSFDGCYNGAVGIGSPAYYLPDSEWDGDAKIYLEFQ